MLYEVIENYKYDGFYCVFCIKDIFGSFSIIFVKWKKFILLKYVVYIFKLDCLVFNNLYVVVVECMVI